MKDGTTYPFSKGDLVRWLRHLNRDELRRFAWEALVLAEAALPPQLNADVELLTVLQTADSFMLTKQPIEKLFEARRWRTQEADVMKGTVDLEQVKQRKRTESSERTTSRKRTASGK